MKGRTLLVGSAIFMAVFTGALWYFQTYAFYDELPREEAMLGQTVLSWEGVDASSSPLKRRVCLTMSPESADAILAAHPAHDDGEPLVAPSWFDCFDAEAIARDIEAGAARQILLDAAVFDGVDEVLAIYPDGRGFVWRQLQPKFRNQ